MFLSKLFGAFFKAPNEKYLEKLQPIIEKINELEPKFKSFSKEELKKKTNELKDRLKNGESLNDVLVEAFALVREAAKRTLGQRHFDVQLMGGIVLHQGKIAEMKTGEGKTLAATLPLYLNALEEKGCHLVTVNDYLTRRDTVWMGQIYHALGLSVGCIAHETAYLYDSEYKKPAEEKEKTRDELGGFYIVEDFLRPCTRKEAYSADITYGTNNEFAFDYLRDNMVFDLNQQVQRPARNASHSEAGGGFHYAIVDEVDSILIDEARTPLIISQPDFESSKMYKDFAGIIPKLKKDSDYLVDEKKKAATLTEEGINKLEKILGVENIYQEKGIKYLHHLEQALRAQVFFERDRDYIVKNGQVIIIDEFTGRLLMGRRYSGGLHQAIEAKERVEVQAESKTLSTITFQNYFRLYKKLGGMTGTAATSAEEFDKVYGLDVIVISTNKPMIRKDLPDRIYKTERGKYKALIEEIKERHKTGQPLLVGTRSVERNEYLSKLLSREGISHQILNAKHHEQEGQIIAQTGRWGAVTIATNMAGRGVDIILGGNPQNPEEAKKIIGLNGLHVIGTERHEARRIDNQLRGRTGRQGDPGSSQFFISLDDELMRIFGGEKIKSLMDTFKFPEDEPIELKIISKTIENAQSRVEGFNFDIRKHVLEYDEVMNKHRETIYKLRKRLLEEPEKIQTERSIKTQILEIIENEIKRIVENYELSEIFEEIKTIFPLSEEAILKMKEMEKEEIFNYLINLAKKIYEQKEEKDGKENMRILEKMVYLRIIDSLWQEHLENMEYLKESVGLRAYGGRDPLVEYKTEGHKMFKNLLTNINFHLIRTIFKLTLTLKI